MRNLFQNYQITKGILMNYNPKQLLPVIHQIVYKMKNNSKIKLKI